MCEQEEVEQLEDEDKDEDEEDEGVEEEDMVVDEEDVGPDIEQDVVYPVLSDWAQYGDGQEFAEFHHHACLQVNSCCFLALLKHLYPQVKDIDDKMSHDVILTLHDTERFGEECNALYRHFDLVQSLLSIVHCCPPFSALYCTRKA